ncbi:hypothetical protein J4210_01775 [Candidatus Woesearchaeota archaeon]|nr:hypothetical protein [Candidatus Woesearchaeota archaeon]
MNDDLRDAKTAFGEQYLGVEPWKEYICGVGINKWEMTIVAYLTQPLPEDLTKIFPENYRGYAVRCTESDQATLS